ncbi:MAG: hypothetical protein JXM70_16515, partial [Pirellulales bacterium]|nr:hypothetical protein [Pirellulales bacterium]
MRYQNAIDAYIMIIIQLSGWYHDEDPRLELHDLNKKDEQFTPAIKILRQAVNGRLKGVETWY